MHIFIDTKFSDFIHGELISIGLVTEDGHEFYAESSEVDWTKCSDFVRVAVLPKLGSQLSIKGTELEIGRALLTWLGEFTEVLVICSDHAYDWEYFCYLVRDPQSLEIPERMSWRNLTPYLQARDVELYWSTFGRNDHHALYDARANKFAFDRFQTRCHEMND